MQANPWILQGDVSAVLFSAAHLPADEKASAINSYYGQLESALSLATATRNVEAAERAEFKLRYLQSQIEEMR